jgi:hypothetical protein
MGQQDQGPSTRRRFRTVWGELLYLRDKIHYWLYTRKEKTSARRYLSRLERVLSELPTQDRAILREEGLALLHELKGETGAAIKHRQREIELMKELHEEVSAGGYDEKMAASILVGRDRNALQERRAILRVLEESTSPPDEGN